MTDALDRLARVSGFLLGVVSIRNLSFAYFFMAPFFVNQGERVSVTLVFLFGYLFSLPIVLLGVCRALCSPDLSFRMGRLAWTVAGLIVICLASVAANSPEKLVEYGKAFYWYLKFIFPALCFLVMVRVWTREDFSRLYTLIFVLVILSIFMVMTQLVADIPPRVEKHRVSAFFRDSNHYALLLNILLAFTIPIGVSRLLAGSHRVGYFLLNAAVIGVLAMTGSRSGFLTASVILGVAVLATRSWKLIFMIGAAAVPVLLAFVIVAKSRYAGGNATLSDLGRVWTYLAAWEMIRANPFLGVGFGNILDAYQDYGRIYAAIMARPMDIHNAFLEIFAEAGVVALALFVLLLGYPLVRLARRVAVDSAYLYPLADLVGLNIAVVFIIHGMVYPEFLGHDHFWAYFSLLIALMRARIKDPGFAFRLFPGAERAAIPRHAGLAGAV